MVAALGVTLLAGCTDSQPSGAAAATRKHETVWLCEPADKADACDLSLVSTVVHPDGSLTREAAPAQHQPVDCFYVYPTVSQAQSTNAPLLVTPVEQQTARAQVARFSSVCRVFAPIYRQVTTRGLFTGKYNDAKARAIAHADVVWAWHDYLARNPHRRFVLIGHSQGTLELLRLLQEEIDPNPALRARLVSALLIGGFLKVPSGATVGGDLKHIPLCTSNRQTGCAVAYNSFGGQPPAGSLFGRADKGRHLSAACTNPAALGGGVGTLKPYFPAGAYTRPETSIGGAERVTTSFVDYPGYLTAQCKHQGDYVWLEVSVHPTPGDRRARTMPTPLGPAWGLHIIDVNLALGNLVALVQAESA